MKEAAKITGLGPNSRTGKSVGRRFNDDEAMEEVLCYEKGGLFYLLPTEWRYYIITFLLVYLHSAVLPDQHYYVLSDRGWHPLSSSSYLRKIY